jgi:adenylosuccinate synthase
MISHVVIGSNYGDEGKGLMTDYLVNKLKAADVTRFNGGSQAGHTVVRNGVRNVFNMYSSGTLAGAQTRIARQCIINMHALECERKALVGKGVSPGLILANMKARVSTPYEGWLNQQAEIARGNNRHGSCGYGINETVMRHKVIPLQLEDLARMELGKICEVLDRIAQTYVPARALELGITKKLSRQDRDELNHQFLLPTMQFLDQFANLSEHSAYFDPIGEHVVYEGAQGLGLDQELGVFPHLTRSNTGLINAVHDIRTRDKAEVPEVHAYFMTRAYLTRHGNGPLENEMTDEQVLCGATVNDPTNAPNPWQGTIRYAPLNLKALARRIYADIGRVGAQPFPIGPIRLKPMLAVTCTDQTTKVLVVVNDGDSPRAVSMPELLKLLSTTVGIPVAYVSTGPSARDMHKVNATDL